MIKISFDFDNCLELVKIQKLAKKLLANRYEVWIVTSRFEPLTRLNYPDLKDNSDIYSLAHKLGIKPYRIAYTNQHPKWVALNQSSIKIHIDDDKKEINGLEYYGLVKGFDCNSENLEESLFEYIEAIENF